MEPEEVDLCAFSPEKLAEMLEEVAEAHGVDAVSAYSEGSKKEATHHEKAEKALRVCAEKLRKIYLV